MCIFGDIQTRANIATLLILSSLPLFYQLFLLRETLKWYLALITSSTSSIASIISRKGTNTYFMAPTIFPELYESSNLCSFRNKLATDRQTKRQITRERKIGLFKRSTIFSKRTKYVSYKDSRKIEISTTKISALKRRTFPRIWRVVLPTFDFLRFLVNLGKTIFCFAYLYVENTWRILFCSNALPYSNPVP